jgi:1-acyl-sn-glycerol-3-phosphate acyltransferase
MTAGSVIRSLAFYFAFYLGSFVLVLAGMAGMLVKPSAVKPIAVAWSAYHRWCVRHLLGISVKIVGTIPTSEQLVAYKHESFFEAIDVLTLFGNPAVFAKAELLRIPLWGKIGGATGLIGVERDQGAKALRAMLVSARHHVQAGRTLVIFPEGTRAKHGTQPPLQSGFAGIYKLLGMPVVPIAVNSGPLYQRRWKAKGTITIFIGEPIPVGLPRDEIETRVWTAINALNVADDRS